MTVRLTGEWWPEAVRQRGAGTPVAGLEPSLSRRPRRDNLAAMISSCPELVARLDRSVEAGSIDAITRCVKADLEDLLGRGAVALPDTFRQPRLDSYARRLLHRDPLGRYTAIVMTWGPGQGTPVHDHGGLWCVEGVIEGQIAVTQYDVTPAGGEEFARRGAWHDGGRHRHGGPPDSAHRLPRHLERDAGHAVDDASCLRRRSVRVPGLRAHHHRPLCVAAADPLVPRMSAGIDLNFRGEVLRDCGGGRFARPMAW